MKLMKCVKKVNFMDKDKIEKELKNILDEFVGKPVNDETKEQISKKIDEYIEKFNESDE